MTDLLALLGGKPAIPTKYQSFIHPQIDVSKTSIMAALSESMISYEGNGIANTLEEAFSDAFSLENTLTFNSGTSALFAMYYGAGLKEGDEVLVPGYTFFATATPLFLLKCRPILVDCMENGNMDPKDILRKITHKTKAIVVTHVWGIPCDMHRIRDIAKKHNLLLFEDASHAHGASIGNEPIGTFGDGAAWSLGAKKLLTGGQGGILATPHKEVLEKALLVGHFNRRALSQIDDEELIPYADTGTGLNLRMHPYAAATVLEQLKTYGEQLAHRRETANMLREEIEKLPGLSLPLVDEKMNPSWYAFPVFYAEDEFKGVSKEGFVKALQAEGAVDADIPATTCPLNRFHTFKTKFSGLSLANGIPHNYLELSKQKLPNCDYYSKKLFKLPTWYGPDRMEYAEYYIKTIKKVIENHAKLKDI